MAFCMEEANLIVSNQNKILTITMGLPMACDPAIISLHATPTKQLMLNFVTPRPLNEEVCQLGMSPSPSVMASSWNGLGQQLKAQLRAWFMLGRDNYRAL